MKNKTFSALVAARTSPDRFCCACAHCTAWRAKHERLAGALVEALVLLSRFSEVTKSKSAVHPQSGLAADIEKTLPVLRELVPHA